MKERGTVSNLHPLLLFERAAQQARRTGRPRLVSVSFSGPAADAVDVFVAAKERVTDAMLWQLPGAGVSLVGAGVAAAWPVEGPRRFADAARAWRKLTEEARIVDESGRPPAEGARRLTPGPGPLAMGGFGFAPGGSAGPWRRFGDGRLVLPRALFGSAAGSSWLTVNTVVKPDDRPEEGLRELLAERERWRFVDDGEADPAERSGPSEAERGAAGPPKDVLPKAAWTAAVARVAARIRAGELEKAVLARSVRVPLAEDFSVGDALRRLRRDYPETYVFAVAGEAGCFLGATPERIARLTGDLVNVACMAGSIGRGRTEEEDRRLGEALLRDGKNLEEHRVVLRSILAALQPVCDGVAAAAEPGLRKFANVQHLYTPVTARARPGVDVLELVSRVHPTPAIGGHPTDKALAVIAEEEQMDRGWYAGPVGWVNPRGEGEFAVALRSGLVRDGEARLFAGCGIMGDSDPESEYEESVIKLRAMMRALEAGGR